MEKTSEEKRKILRKKLLNKVHTHWIRAWIERPIEEEHFTLEEYEKIMELREKNEKQRQDKKNKSRYVNSTEIVENNIVKFKWETTKGSKIELTGRVLKVENKKINKFPYFKMSYEILHCGEIFCEVERCWKVGNRRARNKNYFKKIHIPEIVKETSTEKLLHIYRSSQAYGYSYYDYDEDLVGDAYINETEVPLESIKAELTLHREHIKRNKEKHLKDTI